MSQLKQSVVVLLLFSLLAGMLSCGALAVDDPAQGNAESVTVVSGAEMRLMRTRGLVSLTDAAGSALPFQEAMRLFSGYTVSTESGSLAGISLDETKAVTVDENSAVTLARDGRKLELSLLKGAMYFSIAKPLDAEESFSIRTSTMVLGIRGTSGCVEVLDENRAAVILTSGHAVITAASGEETEIAAGEKVEVDLSSGEGIFTKTDIQPGDYPAVLLCSLAVDDVLLSEANAQNGPGYKKELLDLAHAFAVKNGDLELLAEVYAREQIIVDMDILTQEIASASSGAGESIDPSSPSSGPYAMSGGTNYSLINHP